MAASKAILTWQRLRWILVACWLSLTIRVTIPDYPYGVPLWNSLVLDSNGYWHEVFYISVGWGIGMLSLMLISAWYAVVSFLENIRYVGLLPDGQPVFLRVKRKERLRKRF